MSDFVDRYCTNSKYTKKIKEVMRHAYDDWKMRHEKEIEERFGIKPMFPGYVSVGSLKKKKRRKKKRRNGSYVPKVNPLF